MKKPSEVFRQKLKIINIGIETFCDSLSEQGAHVIHVDWQPPASGDLEAVKFLELLVKKRINSKK